MKRAGLETQTVELTHRYFVTYPLGESFIDPSAPGNVSFPGKTAGGDQSVLLHQPLDRRCEGWAVPRSDLGGRHRRGRRGCGRSGVQGLRDEEAGDYENGEYKIVVGVKDDRGGSRYAMSPLKRV